uniref:Bulb-type lectin domain-containing protein n=1 Tax=Electrophorus electricus TaxID=8005 RepID=A0AAY5EAP7_ELEEL
MSKNSLSTNQEMFKGDYLISNDGNYKAIFQDDGNFVVYGWKPIWASGSDGKPGFFLIMQSDGNLVIYDTNNQPLWASNSWHKERTEDNCLTLNNDGCLTIYRGSQLMWKSS